ncbi:arabinose operon transcriptional regulator AraC [Sodalis sp. RH23]|uniref:arabinose operon transcriptional regulator AraC n=1 Tax=unclassified Sodalis (in: enterobacteria) TaxID=2636512 RepID=UPI0039B3E4C8
MKMNDADMVNFSPLMKSFTFNAYMVSGFTPISPGSKLDFFINRPNGMKGYMLHLTQKGEGLIHTPSEPFICRQDDMLLFPPGIPHHYGRAEGSTAWDHLWIYFIPRPYWIDWLHWDATGDGIGRLRLDDNVEDMTLLFKEVIHHNAANESLADALAMNALERIILMCFERQPISNRHNLDPRVKSLCQYVNEHIDEEIRIDHLARMTFLSPSRLAHLFKREMGQTIFAWREKQRVSRACDLLQKSHLSIAQISLAVGYDDPLYFSRIFRHHLAVSPRDYRKKFEKMPSI